MKQNADIIIVGGGLAGLTSAIHLSRSGLKVTIIEKNRYPKHKVCGEYVSNEVLPYLRWLTADPFSLQPTRINRALISAVSGKTVECRLPLGGFGISRYAFDRFLLNKALNHGCTLIEDTVTDMALTHNTYQVNTTAHGTLPAKMVLGAYGKRSVLDHKLSRNFIKQPSPWLAVKAHYQGNFSKDLVALHNFRGGYCGVSKVENDVINICYLVDYNTFKQYRDIEAYQQQVLFKNIHLKAIFENSRLLFDKPLTISQVSFDKKETVYNHVLMVGDTAGLIHPLCGNGMAMAIHSAKIASELILQYFGGSICSRNMLERAYLQAWNTQFKKRLHMGKILATVFSNERLSETLISGLLHFPALLPALIRQTHGSPLKINS